MQHDRTLLAKDILQKLKVVFSQLSTISSDMEKFSESFYRDLFNENKNNIFNEIEKYQNNIEKIKNLNSQKTTRINYWYEFSRDAEQIKKLTFPIKYYLRKLKLHREIKKVNQEIYNLTIENRLIKDNLSKWEHELETKAIKEIKRSQEYQEYGQLLELKREYIFELQYLLATIPGIGPAKITYENIDYFFENKLKPN